MRIAYFGLPLGALLLMGDGWALDPVVLSPIIAPGRRRLRRLAEGRILDAAVLDTGALAAAVSAALADEPPDLIVSWYWTRKLPGAWLDAARLGGIGVHPSLLPRHRGPNPFFWAIDSGDRRSGVTVHRLEAEYDRGAILAKRSVLIAERNAWQLARALDRPGLELLRGAVARASLEGPLEGQLQDESAATWAGEPAGEDLSVRWHWPTRRVLRRLRALAPVPGLALELGGVPLFLTRACAADHYPRALLPGEAARWGDPARVVVRTGDGAIVLTEAVRETRNDRVVVLDAAGIASTLQDSSGVTGPSGG